MRPSRRMVTGLIIFLAGGAALAFGEGTTSTAIGTTLGLTGLLVAGWGWLGAGGRKA